MAEYNIVNLEPSLAYVSKWIVTLMKYYGWESFWLLTGTDQSTNPWADTGEYLMELAKNNSIRINGETRNARNEKYNTMSNFTYTTTITDSEKKTRSECNMWDHVCGGSVCVYFCVYVPYCVYICI